MRFCRVIRPFGLIINPLRALAATIALALGGSSYVAAQQPCYCPPPAGYAPGYAPGKGGASVSGAPPAAPFGEQLAAAPALQLGEAAPAQTGENLAFAAPNFVGDFFGGASGGGGSYIIDSQSFTQTNFTAPYDNPSGPFVGTNGSTTLVTVDNQSSISSAFQGGATQFAIQDNSQIHSQANALFVSSHGNIGTTVFDPANSSATASYVDTSSGAIFSSAQWNYDYVVALNLPTPGTGGLVGIQKLVENSSPIPRDRILFNYSFFNNVRFTNAGIDVNRYVVGFEKTFFNQMCSVEFRAPFASTMSADQVLGQSVATNTQFGNLTIYGKALMASGPTYAIGGGLGVAAPTASNVNVRDINGTPLVQVQNQAVQLLPYFGAVYAPNPNWYSQAILQVSTPTSGNSTLLNLGNGLTRVGAINDPSWFFASFNAGYWVYRSAPTQRLSGVSPLVELHYNKTLNNSDVINAGNFRIGNSAGNIEMINAVVGANLEFFGRSYLSVAYVAPLTNGADRFFDGELRVLFNRFWW